VHKHRHINDSCCIGASITHASVNLTGHILEAAANNYLVNSFQFNVTHRLLPVVETISLTKTKSHIMPDRLLSKQVNSKMKTSEY